MTSCQIFNKTLSIIDLYYTYADITEAMSVLLGQNPTGIGPMCLPPHVQPTLLPLAASKSCSAINNQHQLMSLHGRRVGSRIVSVTVRFRCDRVL